MISVVGDTFLLHGRDSSYILQKDGTGRLYHLYYGKRLADREYSLHQYHMRGQSALDISRSGASGQPVNDVGWSPKDVDGASLDEAPQEYPAFGKFDLRSPAYQIATPGGDRISDARFRSHRIAEGKPILPGLPHVHAPADRAQTLIVTLKDDVGRFEIDLYYTVFEEFDAICRSARIRNTGDAPLNLHRVFSVNMDFVGRAFDVLCFPGSWSREREVSRRPVEKGIQEFSSNRGGSGHQMNPFVILCDREATESAGEAFGYSLIYSGNHATIVEADQYDDVRVQMGISPATFQWKLSPGEEFCAPECVVAYSESGFSHLSQTYHALYNDHLIRNPWTDADRPVVINNWEATYFDFDEEKILKIAQKAKDAGIDLFVLDDGWFGRRDDDHSSLGDWVENARKLPHGLKGLAERLNGIGIKFGLWMEPEMVSPDSDLYRSHPDWAVRVPGRNPSITRWQYVLNLAKREVREYIVDAVSGILSSAEISYVKWDMNRHITDIPDMEFSHRYVLGLYEILEAVTARFPGVLFEGCSGGGGRLDPGILYYMPQVWASDDSDAMERLKIQYGTSFCYPISATSAHVTAVPNHQTGRITPLKSRGDVASFGQFGYELDVTKLSEGEFVEVKKQVERWKAIRQLVRTGSFTRLASPFHSNLCAWQLVSPKRDLCHVLFARIMSVPNPCQTIFRLSGLDAGAVYRDVESGREYGSDELMYYGVPVEFLPRDFDTVTMIFMKIQ